MAHVALNEAESKEGDHHVYFHNHVGGDDYYSHLSSHKSKPEAEEAMKNHRAKIMKAYRIKEERTEPLAMSIKNGYRVVDHKEHMRIQHGNQDHTIAVPTKTEHHNENTTMETKDILSLVEKSDALGFTNFLKESLNAEMKKQLTEQEVANKHKPEETAAGEKAGNATSQTTATSAAGGDGKMPTPAPSASEAAPLPTKEENAAAIDKAANATSKTTATSAAGGDGKMPTPAPGKPEC